jgi:hypothetical protein
MDVVVEVGGLGGVEVWDLVRAAQDAKEVQVRQLDWRIVSAQVMVKRQKRTGRNYGFPSLPSTTPLGSFLGGASDNGSDGED